MDHHRKKESDSRAELTAAAMLHGVPLSALPPPQASMTELADLQLAGFDVPGWYFWDESQTYCYGPYDTAKEAEQAAGEYLEKLNQLECAQ